MNYYAYEFAHAVLSPMRLGVSGLRSMLDFPFNPFAQTPYGRQLAAACELFENVTRRYGKPEFGSRRRASATSSRVREEIVLRSRSAICSTSTATRLRSPASATTPRC